MTCAAESYSWTLTTPAATCAVTSTRPLVCALDEGHDGPHAADERTCWA